MMNFDVGQMGLVLKSVQQELADDAFVELKVTVRRQGMEVVFMGADVAAARRAAGNVALAFEGTAFSPMAFVAEAAGVRLDHADLG